MKKKSNEIMTNMERLFQCLMSAQMVSLFTKNPGREDILEQTEAMF